MLYLDIICFYIAGYIYVVGGMNDKGPLRTVEQYHMEKERWTHVRKLDRPLLNHAAASHSHMVNSSIIFYCIYLITSIFFINNLIY